MQAVDQSLTVQPSDPARQPRMEDVRLHDSRLMSAGVNAAHQHRVHRRRGQAQLAGDLDRAHPVPPPPVHDLPDDGLRGSSRTTLWAAGPIPHRGRRHRRVTGLKPSSVVISPPLGGRPGHLGHRGRLGRPAPSSTTSLPMRRPATGVGGIETAWEPCRTVVMGVLPMTCVDARRRP
jgi:hypothetical protein